MTPYIPNERKHPIATGKDIPKNVGELNYKICTIIDTYLWEKEKVNYEAYNEIIGVLELVKARYIDKDKQNDT